MAGRKGDYARKHFNITLEPDLTEPLWQFHSAGGYQSISATVNALIRMSLAGDAEKALTHAGRIQAYNEVRTWTITQVVQHMRHLAQLLELSK